MGHTPHKVALHQITTYNHELIPLDRGAVTQTVTLFPFPRYKYRWASLSVILQFFCETDALSILLQRLCPAVERFYSIKRTRWNVYQGILSPGVYHELRFQ